MVFERTSLGHRRICNFRNANPHKTHDFLFPHIHIQEPIGFGVGCQSSCTPFGGIALGMNNQREVLDRTRDGRIIFLGLKSVVFTPLKNHQQM